jgi:hypothetical protein
MSLGVAVGVIGASLPDLVSVLLALVFFDTSGSGAIKPPAMSRTLTHQRIAPNPQAGGKLRTAGLTKRDLD